jgi:glycoside/pentoside/hexuronide:cation symporter, GPH family
VSLNRKTLAAYGGLGLPLAMLLLPVYVHVPKLYHDLGLPLATIGVVLLIARLCDALADPLIGSLADRTPGRRRRRWLLASAPALGLLSWLMLVPPFIPTPLTLLLLSCALYIAWSALTVPYLAYGLELSADYHQRARLAAAREGFGLLGTVLALLLPLLWPTPEQPLLSIAFAFSLLLPLSIWLIWQLPEQPPLRRRQPLSFKRSCVLLRRNQPFRTLISAYFINALANTLPATLFLLFVAQILQADERSAGLCLLIYFAAALVAIPLWLWLARRYGKHRSWQIALLLNCLFFLPALWLSAGDVHLFMIVCVLTGLCLGADLVLPSAMQADVVDADTARGGENRAGLYTALWTMATKLAGAATVGLALPLLDRFGNGLLPWLYAGLPVFLKFLAIALLLRYGLDSVIQQQLQLRINRRLTKLEPHT